ncbi:MAG: hypothetical protein ACPGAP_09535 [Akkermansiaceae bacterium]
MTATFEVAGESFAIVGQLHCDSCVESYDTRQAEHSRTVHAKDRPNWSEICPPAYQQFDRRKLPPDASAIADRVLGWQPGPKGIGLMGESRKGKTFLLYELFRRWYEHGASVCITSGTEFAWACGSIDQHDRRELMTRMIKADMLFIDDLGKEKMTDRVEADLYHVIEQRRRFQRPVFVTVNSGGDALAGKMSADGGIPIVNRLREDVCEFIRVG